MQLEDVEELLLELVATSVIMRRAFGSAVGAGAEQDGFFDAGERVEQGTHGQVEAVLV